MKHRNRFLAGLLSAAVLLQGAAALPSAGDVKPLTAEAASVRSIQTRVFEYDFGGFQALYDNKTGRWFTTEGAPIVSQTEPVQRIENPFFGDENFVKSPVYALIINMTDMTVSFELEDGTIFSTDELGTAYTEDFRSMFTQILEIAPEYNPQYYDKAQQLYADVPEPEGFPLTYVWRIAESESEPDALKTVCGYCDIYFGENLYGSCLAFDGKVTFTKAEDIAEEGSADPFTDEGDVSLDGEQDVSDAVLTSRVVAEIEDTPVSDLGMELADKDGDGLLTGRDVTGILQDIISAPSPQPDPVPNGAIPVIRLEYPQDDINTLAKLFGYESGTALEECFSKTTGSYYAFSHCSEGAEYDVWDLALVFRQSKDMSGWQYSAVQSLILCKGKYLQIDATTYNIKEDETAPVRWIQFRLTVPHGALPQNLSPEFTVQSAGTVPADSDIPAVIKPVKYIRQANGIPVLRQFQMNTFAPSYLNVMRQEDERSLQSCAEHFGFESWAALDDALTSGTERFWHKVTEYDTSDVLMLYYIPASGMQQQFALQALHIDQYGTMDVTVGIYQEGAADDNTPLMYVWELSVPHGELPDIRAAQLSPKQYGSDSEAFNFHTPERLYVLAEPAETTAIPVINLEYLQADLSSIAQTFGYASSEALKSTIRQMDINLQTFAACTEGAEYDIWDFAYHIDDEPGWQDAAVRSLTRNDKGRLQIDALTYADPDAAPDPDPEAWINSPTQWIWIRLTVPHNALSQYTLDHTKWQLTENRTPINVPAVKYITAEDLPEDAIPVMQLWMRNNSADIMAEQFGYESEDAMLEAWSAAESDVQILASCTEGTLVDAWDLLYHQTEEFNRGFYGEYIRTMHLDADGVLQIGADVGRPPVPTLVDGHGTGGLLPGTPYIWVRFTVPHGALPQTLQTNWNLTYCDTIIQSPAMRYITTEPHAEGIRAEVLAESNMRDPGEQGDIFAELQDSESSYVFRQFCDVSDTDDASLKEILAQGKDILAIYAVRGQVNNTLGIMDAALEGDTLSVTLADHCTATIMPAFDHHRVLLITEDGALPDISKVDVTTVKYYDTVTEDRRAEFDAAIKNPVYIQVTEVAAPDVAEAEVIVQNGLQNGPSLPEDIIDELYETPEPYLFRQYREAADADGDPDLQNILLQGKDVLAVYLLRTDGGSEFGAMRAERYRDTLNLMLAEHRDCLSPTVEVAHRILLVTEDGVLPDINTVNIELVTFEDTETKLALTDGSFTWVLNDTRPDFEAAVCNPVYISAAPQDPQISLRGRAAGVALRYFDDDRPGGTVEYYVGSLTENQTADEDDIWNFLSPQKILQKYVSWPNGIPTLTDGDLLVVSFTERGWKGAFGVQHAELYSDGILHIIAAHCDEAEMPTLYDSEGSCATGIICMIGETGAFDGIRAVEVEFREYASYEEYTKAIPQYLSIHYV